MSEDVLLDLHESAPPVAEVPAAPKPDAEPSEDVQEVQVTIEKKNGALGLGFNRLKTFHGAAVVNELFEGGAAAEDGRLRIGDAILKVNGRFVFNTEAAVQAITDTEGPVTLYARRGAAEFAPPPDTGEGGAVAPAPADGDSDGNLDGGDDYDDEIEPYPGEEALEQLWNDTQGLCTEEAITALEEELTGKTREEQWDILVEVYDYLLQEREKQDAGAPGAAEDEAAESDHTSDSLNEEGEGIDGAGTPGADEATNERLKHDLVELVRLALLLCAEDEAAAERGDDAAGAMWRGIKQRVRSLSEDAIDAGGDNDDEDDELVAWIEKEIADARAVFRAARDESNFLTELLELVLDVREEGPLRDKLPHGDARRARMQKALQETAEVLAAESASREKAAAAAEQEDGGSSCLIS